MIVITGVAGMVGGNLARALQNTTTQPIRGLVHRDRRAVEGLDIKLVDGNIRDLESLRRAFQGAKIVCHLAASISLESDNWAKMHAINVLGTRNVVQARLDCGEALGQGDTSGTTTESTVVPGAGQGATLFNENPAFCRAGPSAEYEEEWTLQAGTESPIVGQYENGWYIVKIDNTNTRTECGWVGAGTVQGDAASIPLISAIPPGGSCPP